MTTNTVAIEVGRSPGDHLTHLVHDVTRISLERTDAGADVALQIVSADGTTTLVRFRSPALPDTVDGVSRVRQV